MSLVSLMLICWTWHNWLQQYFELKIGFLIFTMWLEFQCDELESYYFTASLNRILRLSIVLFESVYWYIAEYFFLSFWIRNLNYLIWYVSLKLLYLNFYDEHVVEIWKYFEWGKIVTMFRILGWMLFLPNGNLLQNVSLK